MSNKRPCKACGCPIELIEGPNGKAIPVQRVRTVYQLMDDGTALMKEARSPDVPTYVSHFETCNDPNRFSRGK